MIGLFLRGGLAMVGMLALLFVYIVLWMLIGGFVGGMIASSDGGILFTVVVFVLFGLGGMVSVMGGKTGQNAMEKLDYFIYGRKSG